MAEISYTKTNWVNNVTPLNAKNMNNIENGIGALATELEKKIEKPEVAPTVGTVLKVTAVNDDGTFVCTWAEESGGVDVQIAGTSIVQDGVANIPYATDKGVGVLRTTSANGLYIQDGVVRTYPASDSHISNRNGQYMPLTTKNLDYAVKAAMCDGIGAAWTDTEKAAARSRMGAASCIYRHSINILGTNLEFSFLYLSSSNEQFNTVDKLLDNLSRCNSDTGLPMIFGSGFYNDKGVNTISTRPGMHEIYLMYFDQGLTFEEHGIIGTTLTITDTVTEI